MEFSHEPVLLGECIEALNIKPDGHYLDATLGGGGHSEEIAKRLSTGKLFSVDKDPDAIKAGGARLSKYPCSTVIQSDFADVDKIADEYGIKELDGVLVDLGVSSYQLDNAERGFSYNSDSFLDMRMSKQGISACDIVNSYSKEELAKILFTYGEESFANKIAGNIVKARESKKIERTGELVNIIKEALPEKIKKKEKHPARKTFQALRIEVNDELNCVSVGIEKLFSLLKPGGRLAVISFHSLEDRIVKKKMAYWCKSCVCPPDFPICVCDKVQTAKLLYRKPITATEEELQRNKRSRSAKLRVCIKL